MDVTEVLLSAQCKECDTTIVGNITQMADPREYTFPLYCSKCKEEDDLNLQELICRHFTSRRLKIA